MTKRSPFPGMDPYLERRWGDVHPALCVGIRAALQPNLPAGLRAIGQEEIRLQEVGDVGDLVSARFYPDAAVVEVSFGSDPAAAGAATVATVEPISVRRLPVPAARRWVEIIDATDHDRVVTAIEVLSPGNKAAGNLNREYVRKVLAYLDAGVNVVEIDLLRSTRDRLLVPDADLPADRRADYYTCVNRQEDPGLWQVYPMPLRERLPTVPVPLRATDREVGLELQPLLDRIYQEGGHYYTDYGRPPPRPLSAGDAAWAAGRVAG